MSHESPMRVDALRIERLIDVLSLLSLGEYDPALGHIEIGRHDDRITVLEQGLALFAKELGDARRENLAHVEALERGKRELERKLETIERQQQAIRELTTPIIELWDQILTLPIVGMLDTQRALDLTDRLLQRIEQSHARCVIIDVTGIDAIDTMTTNHFLQMIRAAQLLGTHCVVTGVSPHAAQSLVGLGVELDSLHTLRNLAEGLQHCLRYLHGRNTPASRDDAWKS